MSCIVRKTLSDIGVVEQVKPINTCDGKLVFDQATWLSNYTKLAHARFILNNIITKNSLRRQFQIHKNANYSLNACEALSKEISCANVIIEKFNKLIPVLLSKISRTGNLNVSIHQIPIINESSDLNETFISINNTISYINGINLRSIIDHCDIIDKVSINVVEYDVIDDTNDVSMDLLTHVVEVNLSNIKKMALMEHDIVDAISKINMSNMCLRKYIKQLEEK